jgi:L-ascorbate metabolism protein UlaG (beta-lactamase superfamily)
VYEDEHVHVLAVPAYNDGKPFHPRENDWVGYVFTVDKVTIYHTGDTDLIPEMKDIECNIALLPVSGTYVMNAEEAANAANIIKPDVAIPMHWGALIGAKEDAENFKKHASCKTVILERES